MISKTGREVVLKLEKQDIVRLELSFRWNSLVEGWIPIDQPSSQTRLKQADVIAPWDSEVEMFGMNRPCEKNIPDMLNRIENQLFLLQVRYEIRSFCLQKIRENIATIIHKPNICTPKNFSPSSALQFPSSRFELSVLKTVLLLHYSVEVSTFEKIQARISISLNATNRVDPVTYTPSPGQNLMMMCWNSRDFTFRLELYSESLQSSQILDGLFRWFSVLQLPAVCDPRKRIASDKRSLQ